MRILVVSLSTYSAPYNDGKLRTLGPRLEALTVASGDVKTLWGHENPNRSGDGYEVTVLPLQLTFSNATSRLVGLGEIVDKARPTLIHVECEPWQGVAVQCLMAAKRYQVPIGILFAECGPRLNGVGGLPRRTLGSWVLKRCDYAVGWSASSTRVAERLAPGIRTETFPATGVSIGAPATSPPEDWFGSGSARYPKLAFVGRFAEEKGIDDFLEICDDLARRLPVRVALAGGEGSRSEHVRRWASERSWVSLHGIIPRTAVSSLLGSADVLVCPSRTTSFAEEQFGKAAVEAMAVGTPVFAYDCGALSDVIGRGGVVVPEGAQAKLVDQLESYLVAPADSRVSLCDTAREQAARFSDDALASRLLELWSAYHPVSSH